MGKQIESDSLRVVVRPVDAHPVCLHGPALLFERRNGDKCTQFFACSAYRDQKDCPLYIPIDQTKQQSYNRDLLKRNAKRSNQQAIENANLLQKVLNQNPNERRYCHTCGTFLVDAPNLSCCLHKKHTIESGLSNEQIKRPTTFLRSLSNDKKEAQYFFCDASLKCFTRIFQRLKLNKVICIGAPRLHEYLNFHKSKLQIESILLDFDTRFHLFGDRYFHYNMFNDYFFAGGLAEQRFQQFLHEALNERCCIFTDPPFGCRTEPMVLTLQTLRQTYRKINQTHAILPIFWVFPYYMETYITSLMPEMEMLDYKINYTNHDTYHSGDDGRKLGSPVRLFTNIPNRLIDLSTEEAYRLCKKCHKWVARENQHCNRCNKCPSKNGATYLHCNLCEICVKPTYKHCNNCWRCTQIENHQCNPYQLQLRCMICLQKGHNEINCQKWFERCRKSAKEITKLKLKSIKTGRRICLVCFKSGHNEQSCTRRKHLLQETTFLNQTFNLLTPNSL